MHAGKARFYWCYLELSFRRPFIWGSSAVHLDEQGREKQKSAALSAALPGSEKI